VELPYTGAFEKDTLFGFSVQDYVDTFNYAFGLTDDSKLTDKIVLEAGCGASSLIPSLARHYPAATFIAFDFSTSAFHLARKVESLPNAHIIRADIHKLPFSEDQFDLTYSSGVLHHLPNTFEGLQNLYRVTRYSGLLYSWIYSKDTFCVYHLLRKLLPLSYKYPYIMRLAVSVGLSPLIYAFQRVTGLTSYKLNPEKIRTIVLRIFDNISPEFQHRHTRDNVQSWIETLGVERYAVVNELGFVLKKERVA